MNPLETAWAVLKAPIDYHGSSDLPHDRPKDLSKPGENSGTTTNQEEEDWNEWMRQQKHPYWLPEEELQEHLRDEIGMVPHEPEHNFPETSHLRYREDVGVEEGQGRIQGMEDDIKRLIDEFNAQYKPAENEDPTVGSQPN